MLKSIISFSSLYWISYFLWTYSQISTNSSNVVFLIKIPENLCNNWEIIETNNWIRLLIFEDKINFYFLHIFLKNWLVYCRILFTKKNSENVFTQKYDFTRRLYAQTQDLEIFICLKWILNNLSTTLHTQFNYLTWPVCPFKQRLEKA